MSNTSTKSSGFARVAINEIKFMRPRRSDAILQVDAVVEYFGRDNSGNLWHNEPLLAQFSFEGETLIALATGGEYFDFIDTPERFGDWRVIGPFEYVRRFFAAR